MFATKQTRMVMISGKGGVGKTTITALLLDELARSGYEGRVLAVDGDPAMTLNLALDFPEAPATVADIRDSVQMSGQGLKDIPAGMSREAFLETQLVDKGVLQEYSLRGMSLTLMAMGRGEGRGCYCSVNNTLSKALNAIMGNYDLVVIDNEAGLEHLSRYRVRYVDYFVVVAGLDAASRVVARRVLEVAKEVSLGFGEAIMIVNRKGTPGLKKSQINLYLPEDTRLAGGETAVSLPADAPIRAKVGQLVEKIKGAGYVRQPVSSTETTVL